MPIITQKSLNFVARKDLHKGELSSNEKIHASCIISKRERKREIERQADIERWREKERKGLKIKTEINGNYSRPQIRKLDGHGGKRSHMRS